MTMCRYPVMYPGLSYPDSPVLTALMPQQPAWSGPCQGTDTKNYLILIFSVRQQLFLVL
jgi:hypothetical protein